AQTISTMVQPTESRSRRLWRRRFRRVRSMGFAGWMIIARRIAPWALLIFVTVQIKTLSERVRQVEESEFSKVQNQVEALKQQLEQLRDDAERAERDLNGTRAALAAVNQTLAEAKKGAPALKKAISEAETASEAVKAGMPSADEVSGLSQSVKSAGSQLGEV